ncbi:hypothetical protein PG997_003162 [Apiospora hydei]|uniref:Uncharacterized protein n=1 Tax=Apiospora hydei TaxID=1337664 RepID=A0ABR1WYI6_9PEZI
METNARILAPMNSLVGKQRLSVKSQASSSAEGSTSEPRPRSRTKRSSRQAMEGNFFEDVYNAYLSFLGTAGKKAYVTRSIKASDMAKDWVETTIYINLADRTST